MRKLRFLLLALVALTVRPVAVARMTDRTPVGEIPFTLSADNRMYVTAFVNGSDSLRFLVDTGASSIVLNVSSAKLKSCIRKGVEGYNLGTTGSSRIEYSSGNTVSAGTVLWEKADCAHLSFSPDSWDGVLGLGGLAAFNVEFNYDDLKIYLYPKETIEADSSHVALPFVYKYSVPFVTLPVRLNGKLHHLSLEVDTGSDRVIDLSTPFVGRNGLMGTQKPFAVSTIVSSDGGEGRLENVFFDEVIVGPYILPGVPGAYSTLTAGMLNNEDVDGMIGNNFLKRFNMLIDFKSNIIYLRPNNFLYTPFYDFLVRRS